MRLALRALLALAVLVLGYSGVGLFVTTQLSALRQQAKSKIS